MIELQAPEDVWLALRGWRRCQVCGQQLFDGADFEEHMETSHRPSSPHNTAPDHAGPTPGTMPASPRVISVGQKYSELGADIGRLVEEKQAAYGDSFGRSGEVFRALYPDGIPIGKLPDALAIVRVIDKLFRIATDRDALGESPWRDVAGYALLSVARVEGQRATKPRGDDAEVHRKRMRMHHLEVMARFAGPTALTQAEWDELDMLARELYGVERRSPGQNLEERVTAIAAECAKLKAKVESDAELLRGADAFRVAVGEALEGKLVSSPDVLAWRVQTKILNLEDLPECRRQLPDGSVPTGTRAALQAWMREAEEAHRLLAEERKARTKAQDEAAQLQKLVGELQKQPRIVIE